MLTSYTEEELDQKILNNMLLLSSSYTPARMLKRNKPSTHNKKRINRTQSQGSMVFVEGVLSPKYLQLNDYVLINVPEEMEILGAVPPEFNGRIAVVCNKESDVEVIVEFTDNNDRVTVPIFCICLQDEILQERMLQEGYSCSFR